MPRQKVPVPGIAYHDYIVVVCYLDEAYTVRTAQHVGPPVFTQLRNDFTTVCRGYHNHLDAYRKSFHATDGQVESHFQGYLYNPATFLAFGQADALGIVLVDDFDAVFSILMDVETPVEQLSVSFAPTLDSLGLKQNTTFCELHDLLGCPGSDNTHGFEEHTPLVVYTKYRVAGLASLGEGLLLQQAMYRAMARRITDSLRELGSAPTDRAGTPLAVVADLESLKCVFLDTQGPADVATLMLCTNYTVAVAMVQALRTLNLKHLYDADPSLERRLHRKGLHQAIVHVAQEGKPPSDDLTHLEDNHVFSSTHTTLGASSAALEKPQAGKCNGYISAELGLTVNAGHIKDVKKRLAGTKESASKITKLELERIHPFRVGRHDYSLGVPNSQEHLAGNLPFLSTADFINAFRDLIFKLRAREDDTETYETGVRDLASSLIIPIPDCGFTPVGSKHVPLVIVLDRIRRQLFGKRSNAHPTAAKFDPQFTKERLQELGLPGVQRRALTYVYSEFARHLGTPNHFSHVLDLYDVLATLHQLLTVSMIDFSRSRATLALRHRYFDGQMTNLVDGLLNAVQDAMNYRVQTTQLHREVRDTAQDTRGAFAQITAAADVPLKAGMALWKWIAFGDTKVPRDRAGAVLRLTSHPRTTITQIIPPDPDALCLAHVEKHISHIHRPEEYVDYFHETAHLTYRQSARGMHVERAEVSSALAERIEEIYASLMTHFFIFGSRSDLFLRHLVCSYSVHPISAGATQAATIQRFTELMIRAFLVTEPIRILKESNSGVSIVDLPVSFPGEELLSDHPKPPKDRFLDFVTKLGPFWSQFSELWPKQTTQQFMSRQFEIVFRTTVPHIKTIWEDSVRLYQKYCSGKFPWNCSRMSSSSSLADFRKAIKECCNDGTPLIAQRLELDDGIDDIALTCELIRFSLESSYGQLDAHRRVHVQRNEKGQVDYTSEGVDQKWNTFQVDSHYSGLFCVDPDARRQRLRREIVTLKAFWNLSTDLRARRFVEIVEDNWPDFHHEDTAKTSRRG